MKKAQFVFEFKHHPPAPAEALILHPPMAVPAEEVILRIQHQAFAMSRSADPELALKGEELLKTLASSVVEHDLHQAHDRIRIRKAADSKQAPTWICVALAATILSENGVQKLRGWWQKLALSLLAKNGLDDIELAFLKRNAPELRAALAHLNRPAGYETANTNSPKSM